MSIVSWCLDKESSKTIMVVTTIGLLDLVSDVLFVLTLNDYAFILGAFVCVCACADVRVRGREGAGVRWQVM